jgi:hypothetical protein
MGLMEDFFNYVIKRTQKTIQEGWEPNKKEMEDNIKSFDIFPNFTDVTWERWTLRLSLYGKQYYHYKDTMSRTNKDCNAVFFLNKLGDEELVRTLGAWNPEKIAPDTVILWREFYGNNGQKQYEELSVKVDFRPEIKKLLKSY